MTQFDTNKIKLAKFGGLFDVKQIYGESITRHILEASP